MDKLELKHLAPYLEHGLKILRPDGRTILEMKGINGNLYVFHEERGETFGAIRDSGNKPMLRPLSDLTKEIEHSGAKFAPIELLRKSVHNYDVYVSENEIDIKYFPNYPIKHINIELIGMYQSLSLLFEWHFDVFGLIEKGLAIDIKLVNNGPTGPT